MKKLSCDNQKYDAKELKMGIEVEKEHKDLFEKIKEFCDKNNLKMPFSEEEMFSIIAKSHIKEIGDYYQRLRKMEDEAKEDKILEANLKILLLTKKAIKEEFKYVLITYINEKIDTDNCWIFYSENDDVDTDPYTRAGFSVGSNQSVYRYEDSPYIPPEEQTLHYNL